MTSPFWAAAFLGWVYVFPPACGAIVLCLIARWWWRKWRETRQPVPYALTDKAIDAAIANVTCPWCQPEKHGRCTCGVACTYEGCLRMSRADLDFLDHGAEMPR